MWSGWSKCSEIWLQRSHFRAGQGLEHKRARRCCSGYEMHSRTPAGTRSSARVAVRSPTALQWQLCCNTIVLCCCGVWGACRDTIDRVLLGLRVDSARLFLIRPDTMAPLDTNGPSVTLCFHEESCSNFLSLYREQRLTDIRIMVAGVEFKAHRLVLAAHSKFFDTMFNGAHSMVESISKTAKLEDARADTVGLMLELIYSGRLEYDDRLTPRNLVELFVLLERYQFEKFATPLLFKVADKLLHPSNFWLFLDASISNNMNPFIDLCLEYFNSRNMQTTTKTISTTSEELNKLFAGADLTQISFQTMSAFLDRNLNCPEVLLLRFTNDWIKCNSKKITNSEKRMLYKKIRLTLLSPDDLECWASKFECSDIKKTMKLIDDNFTNIITFYLLSLGDTKMVKEYLRFPLEAGSLVIKDRSICLPHTNVCREEFGFRISNNRSELLYTEADVGKPIEITFDLSFPFKLNVIELIMSDTKGDKYSYLMEYSVDGFNWSILYDYRKYLCSNQQNLFFNPIVARYFRMRGYHQVRMDNRTRKTFSSVNSIKAKLIDLYTSMDVYVTEGVLNSPYFSSQIRHRVYCDSTINESSKERYYCQKMSNLYPADQNAIGFKPIFVMFDQPIMLCKFSFKLYDKGECAYSYQVDIFDHNNSNLECWITVIERLTEKCTGWQNIAFSARPVNIIRITPINIYNTDCQEFRIVKFNFMPDILKP